MPAARDCSGGGVVATCVTERPRDTTTTAAATSSAGDAGRTPHQAMTFGKQTHPHQEAELRTFSPDLSAYFGGTHPHHQASNSRDFTQAPLPGQPIEQAEDALISPPRLSHKPPFHLASVQVPRASPTVEPPPLTRCVSEPARPSINRTSHYTSSHPAVRFVSSYAVAVATCMNQSQLAKRDPRLVGKLLQYFIAEFVRKYWVSVTVLLSIILTVELANQRWAFAYTPLVLAAWLLVKVLAMRVRLTTELMHNVPMHAFTFFKHSRVLARARSLPVARLYTAAGSNGVPGTPSSNHHHSHANADIYFQPSEGYCGQASLNNLLASMPLPLGSCAYTGQYGIVVTRRFFLTLPAVVRPFSLTEMEKYLAQVVAASGLLASAIESVDVLHDWERAQPHKAVTGGGYSEFLTTVSSQINDPRYRFMANFLRTPLFFCEEAKSDVATTGGAVSPSVAPAPSVSLARKLFSGHWSPVLGFMDAVEVEKLMTRASVTPQSTSSSGTPVSSYPPSPAALAARVLPPNAASTLISPATVPSCLRSRSSNCAPTSQATPSPCTSTPASASPPIHPPSPVIRATSDAALHYANYLSATGRSAAPMHPAERAAIGDGLLLVADVNPSYAYYMVPPRRLYDAVSTVNLVDGAPRGIVRITLKATQ